MAMRSVRALLLATALRGACTLSIPCPPLRLRGAEDAEQSVMGRRTHWQEVYARELQNLRDFGDRGECWFAEEGEGGACMQRISDFCSGLVHEAVDLRGAEVVDVGTGNGVMLLELARAGFRRITGTDYVEDAVTLGVSMSHATCRFCLGHVYLRAC